MNKMIDRKEYDLPRDYDEEYRNRLECADYSSFKTKYMSDFDIGKV